MGIFSKSPEEKGNIEQANKRFEYKISRLSDAQLMLYGIAEQYSATIDYEHPFVQEVFKRLGFDEEGK